MTDAQAALAQVREALPSLSALPPMQPYRSPAVVRRPGSDHSHIPS